MSPLDHSFLLIAGIVSLLAVVAVFVVSWATTSSDICDAMRAAGTHPRGCPSCRRRRNAAIRGWWGW